jgi:AraC-like DNA-binding protein
MDSTPVKRVGNTGVTDYFRDTRGIDELEHDLHRLVRLRRLILSPTRGSDRGRNELRVKTLPGLGFMQVGTGLELVAEMEEESPTRIAIGMALEGQCTMVLDRQELQFSSKRAYVLNGIAKRTTTFRPGAVTQTIVADRRKLTSYCGKLLGRDLPNEVVFDTTLALDTAAGQNWVRTFRYAASELSQADSLVPMPPAMHDVLESVLFASLLLNQSHSHLDALLRPQPAAAPYYVKRAEEFIEAHFASPVSLADIAAHTKVSARSLQNGFQNFRGMTPMAFLRSIRLQRAHAILLTADPAHTTVTDIALACGYNHIGEFSAAYRRAYGVLPRETLSRSGTSA